MKKDLILMKFWNPYKLIDVTPLLKWVGSCIQSSTILPILGLLAYVSSRLSCTDIIHHDLLLFRFEKLKFSFSLTQTILSLTN